MAIPVFTSLSPGSVAKYVSLPATVVGSGFFGGGVAFDVSSITIGGTPAVIQPGGTDTSFNILTPVVTNSGSFDVVITTSQGSSVGGPKFVYTEFNETQDRSIDYRTAQFWCYGCPFLEIRSNPRPNSGIANPVSFDSVEPRYANTTKTHYWCGAPNPNFNQRISQEMSYIGVGWCPFAEQKWQTLYNQAEDY
jgi:hypothetical protein